MAAATLGTLEELESPPDPRDPFADEAENRLEQDLLMVSNGCRTRVMLRRIRRYKTYMSHSALQGIPCVLRYKEQVLAAAAASADKAIRSYVPGDEVGVSDSLRDFSRTPILLGPLPCQLCDDVFVDESSFASHQIKAHGGEAEYRKRVLYLLQQSGPRPITAQEKRVMVQNFAHFQEFSHPGAKSNTFARTSEVPRCEAACVLCQQKDWLEQRHKLSLWRSPPPQLAAPLGLDAADPYDDAEADAAEPDANNQQQVRALLQRRGDVYYLQSPERVHELLNVDRYAERWPLIPLAELHASSVQHPEHPDWRWLLHVRRVSTMPAQQHFSPSSGAPQDADTRPPCAGVGDPDSLVWVCWECLADIGGKKPKLPVNSCANDNWIGRERKHVREASAATKMLASLGRCCMKQVRLGKHGDPALQERALTGNTIFFAQPAADVPSLELPPPCDALVDSLNVIFTRSVHDLSKAEWAIVERQQYMRIVRERKLCCPTFSPVLIREEEAATRLPEKGVPEHIRLCLQEVQGSENAPVRLKGPADRAPEIGKHEEAGDTSDATSECDSTHEAGAAQPASQLLSTGDVQAGAPHEDSVAEDSIAVDPTHELKPVRLMQALQAKIDALQAHAQAVIRNEKAARIQGIDGTLRPVVDEGGREVMHSLILDVQSTARSFDDKAQASVERALAQADTRLSVCPTALAMPTQGPLDSFSASTYPACYVEWWYGDGAPGLKRDRPMLFEQVARRLINIEEHEYHLADDEEIYRAACKSRFNKPELIAVFGDVVRRMRILKGTRAAIGRKGFTADLKAIASASSADFQEALKIAGPRENIGSACARSEMPAKVKTALRTLLLSTSDVAGTEGRKAKLRYDGNGNNYFFGGPSLFCTPNFADTRNPLVKKLHDGPGRHEHLMFRDASRVAECEPEMPSLRRMHEIVAAGARAQAKFFLLMSELHYRYIVGVNRLHIGRVTLAMPRRPMDDEVAASLQPCVTPGTTDVQAPLEAQGRGFTHGHGKGHSILGATMTWLRRALDSGLTSAVQRLRDALLSTAVTVQFDSARECGRQMHVEVRAEPFSRRQQRQSRMDGGEDDDGTLRELVELAPPVEQPHLEREQCRAAAESRPCRAANFDVPLTGAFQSTFPVYRQMHSFGLINDAAQLTAVPEPEPSAPHGVRRPGLAHLFSLGEEGEIHGVLNPDGSAASEEDLHADARRWAENFAQDAFNNHCNNHEHDCTETCIKYAKKQLEAKQSLRSHRNPACRFWFFRLKKIGGKLMRRRGKPLVTNAYFETNDERRQEFRCQVPREQPFRSTSNDVAQVTDRCNVDFQFLLCAPPLPSNEGSSGDDDEPVTSAGDCASDRSKRRRLTERTPALEKVHSICRRPRDCPAWFPRASSLTKSERACIQGFAASFQKAASMDFYITKYQGKPMESLTPLFMHMTSGIHRLEQQEEQERQEQETATAAEAAESGGPAQPAPKRRKTREDDEKRARRVTIRLASMANRSFWVSAAELVVHILTDGDCLQSHRHIRIFTRQLQWAMHECQRHLNGETTEEPVDGANLSVQAVSFHVANQGEGVCEPSDDGADSDVDIEKIEACTTSTNASDDYAHRGQKLSAMCFYVYRMYVRRVRKRSPAPNIFGFEKHYVLAQSYVQEVVLHNVNIPTIDGFHCPTVDQDAEQNALLKTILFSPWSCTDPMTCGSAQNFRHLLSNGTSAGFSGSRQSLNPRKFTFLRAWRPRCSEINVLATRADKRCDSARKKLVMADTTLFAENREGKSMIQLGEDILNLLRVFCVQHLNRSFAFNAGRLVLAFLDVPCRAHTEQCSLAEFSSHVIRDVIMHIDLAAEARCKPKRQRAEDVCADSDSDSDDRSQRPALEFVDLGGGEADAIQEEDDVGSGEQSSWPLRDVQKTLDLCLQRQFLEALPSKARKSQGDLELQALSKTYSFLLGQSFSADVNADGMKHPSGFGRHHADMIALQKRTIELAKKQQTGADHDSDHEEPSTEMPSGAAEAVVVPMPLAMQGPGAVTLHLLKDATCTEEQTDAAALLALSMQKRFDARADKSSLRLPVATPGNNHRAVWLGGGGVGKTHLLKKVVEPLADTYFGSAGYCATAQSNQAAQNLGSRGRTLHSANGLLMTDSLQTARLRLNAQSRKKLERLTGDLGIDVTDEVGAVPAEMLHADALRKSYGRSLRHGLDPTNYMTPSETWGRMPVKILSGDFYQLPPVPVSASLLAPLKRHSYEHQQGRKLLLDMEYVVDFTQMQRFTDPLLVEILEAMRTPGGKEISEAAWSALQATVIGLRDPRLRDARGWYECAYEWRIVSYAMHAHARLNAKAAEKVLCNIPSVDNPAGRMSRVDFDDMRGHPNIGESAKLAGILPIYIGMDMILTESYLLPRIVRGTAVQVVGVELHPEEIRSNRSSVASDGCLVLHYLPKCIYVRVCDCTDVFLAPSAAATQPGSLDLRGVLAVQTVTRPWKYKTKAMEHAVSVTRRQFPLLPRKQCTFHGVQGNTAEPGFIAHWSFPKGLSKESVWLAHYVGLSRPRSLATLLCHSLPDRGIIEGGPPETISKALDELFARRVEATQAACANARRELGWPPRP
eukprot:NODE_1_length_8589_cov_4.556480.p1 GENE.NODE_1_length_8589_cov_4.556480~~NODE_1_length_8589_cov_4.556480.p1  ORF type:complete len:2586 (+),score=446.46 NODE_1_length_8589_cov_4.556480:571-8328(+)